MEQQAGFEYYKGQDGDWRWRLRAKNGRIVAQGEGYTSKRNCLRGIGAVQVAVLHAAQQPEQVMKYGD